MLKYIQSSIFSNAVNDTKKDGQPDKQTKSEEAISLKSSKGESKLPFRKAAEPKELAKAGNGPNSLINLDEPTSNLLANDLLSDDLMASTVMPDDQVESVSPTRENLFAADPLNDLESIKEDPLTSDLLSNEAALPVAGIDELDNFKLENNLTSGQNEPSHEEPASYDGNWYLKKLDEEISRINEKIGQIEAICLDEHLNNREEIDGKIRSAIGKGNLLINQKLSQFKELCNKNLVSSSSFVSPCQPLLAM